MTDQHDENRIDRIGELQQQMARLDERLSMLSAASFEGLLVHVDNSIIELNDRMTEMVGYSREELLGPEAFSLCIAPEDQAGVAARVAGRVEGDYHITMMRKDGSRFRAELLVKQGRLGERPVRVVAVRDVTKQEQTQALLRESERRLQQLADVAFDFVVLSRDGIIIDVHGPIDKVLGFTREEIVGRSIVDLTAPEKRPAIEEVLAEQRVGTFESMILAADGRRVPMAITGVSSTLDGRPVRLAGVRDLSEARRREAERRELEHRVQLSQRLESLGVLAGGIAHDFNNLLVVIQGHAELLSARLPEGLERESAQSILLAAERAASLTAKMLAYVEQREPRRREVVDMARVVAELRTLLAASLSKRAQLVPSVEPGLEVDGDPTALSQVLMNLLTNASDALGDAAGRIEVRGCRVSDPGPSWGRALGAPVGAGRWVLVEVIDEGIGMDEATLARIFDPFFTTKKTGHGLGLAACLGIVRAHAGAILVQSQPGRGSTFSVLLPARPEVVVAASGHGEGGAAKAEARREQAAPCRVLVVDDETSVRNFAARLLTHHGFEVALASNGQEAIDAIAASEPDVVLLDFSMPDVDGLQVLERIRASGSQVPVILSSGYFDPSKEADAFQAFLQKPYRGADLLASIERVRRGAGG